MSYERNRYTAAQALAYEISRQPVVECEAETRLLLRKLAEYHCEHNGLKLDDDQIDDFVQHALEEQVAIQAIIDIYAIERDLF